MPLLRKSRPDVPPPPPPPTLDERLRTGQVAKERAEELAAAASRKFDAASEALVAVSRDALEESTRLAVISNEAAISSNVALRRAEEVAASEA